MLDEPVSALDVSIRAQILNLLKDLQERLGLSYVLIAHHLATIRHMSHQVAVMYLGQIVERAPGRGLFARPLRPYTQALYAAALSTHPDRKTNGLILSGEVPSPLNPPSGCRFHPRCRYATEICQQVEPPLADYGNGHLAACHHPLNVDEETLERVRASPNTPANADESALPQDTSGESHPVPNP